jgi:hypothetical protein
VKKFKKPPARADQMTKQGLTSSTYVTALLHIVKCEFQNGSGALGLPLQRTGRINVHTGSLLLRSLKFIGSYLCRITEFFPARDFSAQADSAEFEDHWCVIRTECRIEAHSREVLDVCYGEEGLSSFPSACKLLSVEGRPNEHSY